MTVSYQYEVASSTSGGFTRLLLMWRGSLYKLIYRELLLYLLLFGIMSALYRHAFTSAQKREFEKIVVYCDTLIKLIPLSFVLGFYVSYVAQRWWKQYKAIPWPDKVMHLVALYITGNDEYSRMLRRALMRYLNLSLILVLRSISSAVKRRFPTLDHVVDSGFMTTLELELYQSVPSVEFNTYWIPCTWFINLLKEARKSHRLPDAQGLKIIMEEFNEFRTKCGLLWSYDWVSIPLVYTQVVTLATYSFFGVALIGRQYIDGSAKPFQLKIDKYLPIFTILQFFFFMGLLKVAEQLINPFGDDDEDFELNWLIDRHIKVSYLGVDTLMNRCPPLVKDIYYDFENLILPYTEAAAAYKKETYRGSVANMTVPEEKQMMFLPRIVEEEEEENKRTPRTSSTANLTNPSDSPVNERRQISESPPMPLAWKVARNCAETVVQLDGQEQPVEPEQRRVLIEAVKRFSSLAKGSAARSESRKAFFPIFAKSSSKPPLQPWPSAANISRSAQGGTSAFELDGPWAKDIFKDADRRPSENSEGQPSISSQSEMDREGVVNSAFSGEKLENVPDVCEWEDHTSEEEHISESASPACQCREQKSHQQLPAAGTTDVSRFDIDESRCPPIGSYPKYLIRRDRSTGGSRKRKGISWRPMMPRKSQKFRRRTTDNIPAIETILSQTRSSPNLSNLEEQPRAAQEVAKIDPSCTQESVSKL